MGGEATVAPRANEAIAPLWRTPPPNMHFSRVCGYARLSFSWEKHVNVDARFELLSQNFSWEKLGNVDAQIEDSLGRSHETIR